MKYFKLCFSKKQTNHVHKKPQPTKNTKKPQLHAHTQKSNQQPQTKPES